jgi:hypothetical protein
MWFDSFEDSEPEPCSEPALEQVGEDSTASGNPISNREHCDMRE